MNAVLPYVAFAGFMAVFYVQARREGMTVNEWLRRRNRHVFTRAVWWRPTTAILAVVVAGFIIYVTITHGWRWGYLLALAIVAVFWAAAVLFMGWWARRFL